MRRNIYLWALGGLLVACCWILAGVILGPEYNLGRSAIVSVTAPAAFLGRKFPLTFYWFALLNAGMYAVVGAGAEWLRQQHRGE